MRAWHWGCVAAATLVIGGEGFARLGLGLGTPPLYETHPTMEYRLVANQSLHRFGNLFETNERNMRSPTLIGETRPIWLVAGDSVPFGGSQIDQSELATTILSNETRLVANLSAGSWGPENIHAALVENADLPLAGLVVVLNGEDLADVPTFVPLDPDTHPTRAPVLALQEGITRYLPRYLPAFGAPVAPAAETAPTLTETALAQDEALLEYLGNMSVPVCIVLHPKRAELEAGTSPDLDRWATMAAEAQIPVVSAGAEYNLEDGSVGRLIFIDEIHLTARGQAALARAIENCMTAAQAETGGNGT